MTLSRVLRIIILIVWYCLLEEISLGGVIWWFQLLASRYQFCVIVCHLFAHLFCEIQGCLVGYFLLFGLGSISTELPPLAHLLVVGLKKHSLWHLWLNRLSHWPLCALTQLAGKDVGCQPLLVIWVFKGLDIVGCCWDWIDLFYKFPTIPLVIGVLSTSLLSRRPLLLDCLIPTKISWLELLRASQCKVIRWVL